MRVFTSPSPTAIFSRCPQCSAVTRIKLVEPDLKEPSKERHVLNAANVVYRAHILLRRPNQKWRSMNKSKLVSFILSSSVSRCTSRVQPPRVSNLPNRCRNSASRRFSMLSERSRTSASNWSLTKLHSSTGLLGMRLALSPLLALSLQSF